MPDNQELYKKTKKLLRQLNHFLVHVVIYFISNVFIAYIIFQNISEHWWLFFFIFSWAIGIIYHALRVYGVDVLNNNDDKLSKMWSWI